MVKVTTVWGSPSSGESMFCYILAKALTRDKGKTIPISADISIPILPVWLPEQLAPANASIGQVLSSMEIDTALATSRVTVLKSYPFIGLTGYCAGGNPLNYPEMRYDIVMALTTTASRLVDFVTLDCSSAMTSIFTPTVIGSGDLVIRILTPDLKGIHYLEAHQPLLAGNRFRYHEHLTFAGLTRLFHAIGEMGCLIGGFDGLLPYGKEVDRRAVEDGMFHAISYYSPKYTVSLNKVLEILEPKEEERQQNDFVEGEQEECADERSERYFFRLGSQ